MIKAVIFDMDGLMIDSERLTYKVYDKQMKAMGYDYSEEFYKSSLGMARPEETQLYYDVYGEDFPMEEFWQKTHEVIDEILFTNVPIKKGLLELLKYLKENGYKTMVATSSERHRVDKILACAKVTSYFDDVICGDEVAHSKPDPEIFLKACKKMQVDIKEALVLEDSEAGILAAHDGGIDVICIPDMKYPGLAYAGLTTRIYETLEEVIPYLQEREEC